MAGLCTVNLVGNLGRDPEQGQTSKGTPQVRFSVAVSRRRGGEETTSWYAVTCWGYVAQQAADLHEQGILVKGTQVFVSGRLEPREYVKDGATRTSLDVVASELQFVGGRGGGEQRPAYDSIDEVPF